MVIDAMTRDNVVKKVINKITNNIDDTILILIDYIN